MRLFPLASLIALSACHNPGPTPEPMATPALPAGFASNQASNPERQVPEAFAEAFGDPRLGTLIEEALLRNKDLGAAASRVLGASAALKGSQAAFQPTLDGTAGAGRSKQVFVGLPIPGSSDVLSSYSTSFDAGLSAAWEPDLWGRLSAGERMAEAALGAQAEEWKAARLSIAAAVTKGWYSLLAARLQADWAQEAVDTWDASLNYASARKEAGVGSALDVALLEARVASAGAVLAQREEIQDQAARSLEILLGRYPSGALQGPAGQLPELPEVQSGLPVELLARRPDLRAAEWQLENLRSGWDMAATEWYPRLALTGNLGQTSDALEDLLDGDFTVWSMAARLTAPLWDGGRRQSNLEGAEARIREAEFQFLARLLMACSEVETALSAEKHLAKQATSLEAARRASIRAKELVQARREQGLIPISEVLEADRARIQAESEWLAVQQARVIRRVELIAALGGGLEEQ